MTPAISGWEKLIAQGLVGFLTSCSRSEPLGSDSRVSQTTHHVAEGAPVAWVWARALFLRSQEGSELRQPCLGNLCVSVMDAVERNVEHTERNEPANRATRHDTSRGTQDRRARQTHVFDVLSQAMHISGQHARNDVQDQEELSNLEMGDCRNSDSPENDHADVFVDNAAAVL